MWKGALIVSEVSDASEYRQVKIREVEDLDDSIDSCVMHNYII